MKNSKKIKSAYFIGIGGAGMSGIAKVMNEMGLKVSGSDIKESDNIKNLRSLGITVKIGHDPKNIIKSDVVVSSTAIPQDNPELKAAKKRKMEIWHRAKALAYVARDKNAIAVCGTHGKTTTTSMVALLLEKLKTDPTFLIGGELNDIGSNAKYGKGKWLAAEADESDGSLIHLHPKAIIITNVEEDHLDYFKDYEEIEKLFIKFVGQVDEKGIIVYNGDHENLGHITSSSKARKVTFGFNKENDYQIKPKNNNRQFSLHKDGKKIGDVNMKVFGLHNMLNAASALALANELGFNFKEYIKIISEFNGVKRRFQNIYSDSNIEIVDDYAHHPTEIKATLSTARKKFKGRIICVFQPHRYTRTMHLKKLFAQAFNDVDLLVLTDIYSAGEYPIPGVTGKLLVDEVIDSGKKEVAYMPTVNNVSEYLKDVISTGDTLITMGAGDVWQVGREIAKYGHWM